MLEYNFNDLDNDFITIWSHWILHHDTSAIMEPLTRLAEMGQINAIQSYYLLKKENETNEVIDRLVNSFYGQSFNESFAIANKIYSENRKEIDLLRRKIAVQGENYLIWEGLYPDEYIPHEKNSYGTELDNLIKYYSETNYGKQIKKTVDLGLLQAKNSRLALVYQRVFEVISAEPIIFKSDIGERDIKNVRNTLRARVKNNTNYPSSFYALGKNLLFFGKKDKEKYEGSNILRQLSERELSINKVNANLNPSKQELSK